MNVRDSLRSRSATEAEEKSQSAQPAALIIFDGVAKEYNAGESRHVVFEEINLEIHEGEFLCLLGPSGCGKSTFLNMLAGFEVPTRGRVTVGGQQVHGTGRDRGVVFQTSEALFDWLDVAGNVELALKVKGVKKQERQRIRETYLSLVGLKGQNRKFPNQLSGGMRQRVQLARLLANDPQILLMDEPFGALDSQTRRSMQVELVRIWNQSRKTVLFITHDIDEAIMLADRIVVMSSGPGAVIADSINVDFERPRQHGPRFMELWNRIDAKLGHSPDPEGLVS